MRGMTRELSCKVSRAGCFYKYCGGEIRQRNQLIARETSPFTGVTQDPPIGEKLFRQGRFGSEMRFSRVTVPAISESGYSMSPL